MISLLLPRRRRCCLHLCFLLSSLAIVCPFLFFPLLVPYAKGKACATVMAMVAAVAVAVVLVTIITVFHQSVHIHLMHQIAIVVVVTNHRNGTDCQKPNHYYSLSYPSSKLAEVERRGTMSIYGSIGTGNGQSNLNSIVVRPQVSRRHCAMSPPA